MVFGSRPCSWIFRLFRRCWWLLFDMALCLFRLKQTTSICSVFFCAGIAFRMRLNHNDFQSFLCASLNLPLTASFRKKNYMFYGLKIKTNKIHKPRILSSKNPEVIPLKIRPFYWLKISKNRTTVSWDL